MVHGARAAAAVETGCLLAAVLLFVDMAVLRSDLRDGLVPVAAGLLALSAGGAVLLAGQARLGRPARVARVASTVTAVGLVAVAAFFLGLAALAATGSALLDSDTALASAGTLAASVLLFVLVPVAALVLGVCLVRQHGLPWGLRLMPLALVAVVLVGGLLMALVPDGPERWVQLGWFVALCVLVSWFAAMTADHGRGTEPSALLAH